MAQVRRFNRAGIERAREFLDNWKTSKSFSQVALDQLLQNPGLSSEFDPPLRVERQPISSKRDAARILKELFTNIDIPIADDDGLWSWLGMFFAPEYPPGPRTTDDAYVFLRDESTTELRRAYQRRYRHALRASYLIDRQHGESAAFLLDQPINSFALEDRLLSDFRAFTSVGVVQLAIALYTHDGELKPRYSSEQEPGNLRHLLRVLNQLERTYDVYGMKEDALMDILPPEFDRWKSGGSSTTEDDS